MSNKLQALCRKLQYSFNSQSLLKQALTHRSADPVNNERLEFLGDSALSLVIAEALFSRYPDLSEGKLSRLRSILVRGDMLAEVALELNLGEYLILGQGELKSGGFRRASILADALEAIFAAVYLDGGFSKVREVILYLFDSRLSDESLPHSLKDDKTRLQEVLQSQKRALPQYILLETIGEEHDQTFKILCKLESMELESIAIGPTRRKAEQAAAKLMLEMLGEQS